MVDVTPSYKAPDALVRHCMRATAAKVEGTALIGSRDKDDVATLLRWMVERDAFSDYESWLNAGLALKLEYGVDGVELWEICHDDTVTADIVESKWNSFSDEPKPGMTTLNSLLQRAHQMGWRGQVRKSTSAMFDGVAQIAAAAGATLASSFPAPAGGMPMMGRGEKQAEHGGAILDEFLAATATDTPARPQADDVPQLPVSLSEHGLFHKLNDVINRVVAMAESPKFKASRIIDVMGILSNVHPDVFDAVSRRICMFGHTLPTGKIKNAGNAFSNRVERALITIDDWKRDHLGKIQNDNSDNCLVLLAQLSLDVRWNLWLERMEIKGGVDDELRWTDWTYVDDSVIAKLRTRANRTEIRFMPAEKFFWESLETISRANGVDPVRDLLAEIQAEWDGVSRLGTWLPLACGVPDDAYHQAVSRNIIGGMVRRIRQPGCKHDFMPVFYGPQGTGKSTIAAIIADMGKSTLAQIIKQSTEWFSDEVMLGDASKELVLSLAGKCVVEIAEMGMRGSANPNHVKAMISRQIDRGRTAYARSVSDRPRRNVFFGTTNDDEPLVDTTGNRRFLPVRVDREVNLAWMCDNIRQIIGEAATLEAAGNDFALPRDVWSTAGEHQEAARSATDMEILLQGWFAPTEHTANLSFITAEDLIHLSNLCGWRGPNGARSAIMKRMGFRSEKPVMDGRRPAVWVRGACPSVADIPRLGVRYMVGTDSQGRPTVGIRSTGHLSTAAPVMPVAAPPSLPTPAPGVMPPPY